MCKYLLCISVIVQNMQPFYTSIITYILYIYVCCNVQVLFPHFKLSCLINVQDMRFKQEGQSALESLQNLVQSDDGWSQDKSSVSMMFIAIATPIATYSVHCIHGNQRM